MGCMGFNLNIAICKLFDGDMSLLCDFECLGRPNFCVKESRATRTFGKLGFEHHSLPMHNRTTEQKIAVWVQTEILLQNVTLWQYSVWRACASLHTYDTSTRCNSYLLLLHDDSLRRLRIIPISDLKLILLCRRSLSRFLGISDMV